VEGCKPKAIYEIAQKDVLFLVFFGGFTIFSPSFCSDGDFLLFDCTRKIVHYKSPYYNRKYSIFLFYRESCYKINKNSFEILIY